MSTSFAIQGGFTSLATSSRVRLARNLAAYPFAGLSQAQYEEIGEKVFTVLTKTTALESSFSKLSIEAGSAQAQQLVEKHQISPIFAQTGGYLIVSHDGYVSIMIGEEDHLRIQVIGQGLCPKECLETAKRIATLIENELPFAYDSKLGYLTACPTNVGTGLRASVMLHLPALTGNGGIGQVMHFIGRAGYVVRGAYGEGSNAVGSFYQLSNQVTLGLSAEDLTEKLVTTTTSVIEAEKKAREALRAQDEASLKDRIYRAVGLMTYAYKLTSKEAIALISDLLVGLQMDYVTGADPTLLYELEQNMNAEVQGDSPTVRDEKRAQRMKTALSGLHIKEA